ncbi:MAG: 3-deoxy-8-phosphooctulonate synthase [Deltaproteobacteria bacterium]|nr:3-deoxy-8-phosphooctulonate synthase [Deltaproteobacteria bacterium]
MESAQQPAHIVEVTPQVKVGGNNPLLLIAGPCQIESLEHCLQIGEFLKKVCAKYPVNLVFKSSYDKANRTSISTKRGLGIDEGLRVLEEVRRKLGVPVLTDVHSPEQASAAGEVVDIIQTPAFLCRQTDLLIAAGKTGKTVNVKKGQFLAPDDMQHVAKKVASTGNHKVLLCERGACFGYRDLVVDMRNLPIMRQTGYPVVFDATHSVQSMGGASQSGGDRRFILPLLRAAVAVGVDGIFIECHDRPETAPSDGASMLPLHEMEAVIATACRIRDAAAPQKA